MSAAHCAWSDRNTDVDTGAGRVAESGQWNRLLAEDCFLNLALIERIGEGACGLLNKLTISALTGEYQDRCQLHIKAFKGRECSEGGKKAFAELLADRRRKRLARCSEGLPRNKNGAGNGCPPPVEAGECAYLVCGAFLIGCPYRNQRISEVELKDNRSMVAFRSPSLRATHESKFQARFKGFLKCAARPFVPETHHQARCQKDIGTLEALDFKRGQGDSCEKLLCLRRATLVAKFPQSLACLLGGVHCQVLLRYGSTLKALLVRGEITILQAYHGFVECFQSKVMVPLVVLNPGETPPEIWRGSAIFLHATLCFLKQERKLCRPCFG